MLQEKQHTKIILISIANHGVETWQFNNGELEILLGLLAGRNDMPMEIAKIDRKPSQDRFICLDKIDKK